MPDVLGAGRLFEQIKNKTGVVNTKISISITLIWDTKTTEESESLVHTQSFRCSREKLGD